MLLILEEGLFFQCNTFFLPNSKIMYLYLFEPSQTICCQAWILISYVYRMLTIMSSLSTSLDSILLSPLFQDISSLLQSPPRDAPEVLTIILPAEEAPALPFMDSPTPPLPPKQGPPGGEPVSSCKGGGQAHHHSSHHTANGDPLHTVG